MPLMGPKRLSVLTFPQRWEPDSLTVRFLYLPKGDLEAPLQPGEPAFAVANLVFEANVIRGLERLPRAVDAVGLGSLVLNDPPLNKPALFSELTQQFNIVAPAPKLPT